jgi:hypothetical protein
VITVSRLPTDLLKPVAGLAILYVTAGLFTGLLASNGTVWSISLFAIHVLFWPILLASIERAVEGLIGAGVGLGVLSVLDRSRLPVTRPRFIPLVSERHFAEFLGTLSLAELTSRLLSPLFFVANLHLFPTYQGTPKTTIAATWTYYSAGSDVIAARWGGAHLLLFGRLLNDTPSILAGEAEIAYAAYEVGDVALFGGIGFAVLLGYSTSLVISYGLVRATGYVVFDSMISGGQTIEE